MEDHTHFCDARYCSKFNPLHQPYGLIQPLPWDFIALDFIIDLPSYKGFDGIINALVLNVFTNEVNELLFGLNVPHHMSHHLVFHTYITSLTLCFKLYFGSCCSP